MKLNMFIFCVLLLIQAASGGCKRHKILSLNHPNRNSKSILDDGVVARSMMMNSWMNQQIFMNQNRVGGS